MAFRKDTKIKNNFTKISIGLASPEEILENSSGEVLKPETINYRTYKPERDGLFCERIFGPTKDYECHCGKYKRIRYKGIVCDRCGVEVTKANVRRERMGHIELAAPVSHIWYFKGIPSRMGLLLNISPRQLEKVIYFVSYIVLDGGDTPLEKMSLLTETEYRENKEKYGNGFRAGIGAEAIKELLEEMDLDALYEELKEEVQRIQNEKGYPDWLVFLIYGVSSAAFTVSVPSRWPLLTGAATCSSSSVLTSTWFACALSTRSCTFSAGTAFTVSDTPSFTGTVPSVISGETSA